MKLLGKASISALFLAIGLNASATVLTFDDISTNSIGTIADGYGGLDWGGFGYLDSGSSSSYQNSGYENGTVSGDYVAYNEFGRVGTVSNSTFDFNGTYLAGAWRDGLNIEVSGYNGGSLLYQTTVVVNHDVATWFDFDFFGIDQLTFSSFGGVEVANLGGSGSHFAMDNFTIDQTAVPEPATLGLLGLALCGLGVSSRRRRT